MVDMVTATPSIVGFTNGHNGYNGYDYKHGISDKDQMFAQSIDAGERTRDILAAIANGITAVEKTGAANSLATEKVGAANLLATEKVGAAAVITAEKIGAANLLASEKIGAAAILATEKTAAAAILAAEKTAAANMLAMQLGFKDAAMQLAECCCDIKKDIAGINATILSVDAGRIRDALAQSQAELMAIKYRNGNGNGNS